MSLSHRPFIALADPDWIGHRETYFREFTLSLLRIGADVAALGPFPKRLQSLATETSQNPGAPRVFTSRLTEPARPPVLDRLPQDPLTTLQRWRHTTAALADAEQQAGRRVDFLFFPWLDSFLRASLSRHLTLAGIHCPWAGLYFQPYHLIQPWKNKNPLRTAMKGDSLLRAPGCAAVGLLDETLTATLGRVSGKPVIIFPDITNEAAPDPDQPFARRILATAAGRKIIGLIGLERRKGVTTLLRAADLARAEGRPWLFVLAGYFDLQEFSDDERPLLIRHLQEQEKPAPDCNVLFQEKLRPIPDGPAYNGIMATFDILYAAYHDFKGSSNALTKAAMFRKPVISTDAGCIGQRTRDHALGLTIPQGNADACCHAISLILEGKNTNGTPLQPRFNDYHQKHSRARLDAALRELVALLPTPS